LVGARRAILALGILFSSCGSPALAQNSEDVLPRFRHADNELAADLQAVTGDIILLTDSDFAPWSFTAADNAPIGISVDLARAACGAAKMACTIKAMPFQDLQAALARKEGDAIISGLRPRESLLAHMRFTRPYFLSLGRFAVRQGTSLPSSDARALAGKRIGHVKNSAHGVFLERHYAKSQLQSYDTQDAGLESLRTGALDLFFGDAVALSFWLAGSKSRACCQSMGKAFVDRDSFSRELVFMTRPDREDLRDVFDAALDDLEAKGETAKIFSAYLPGLVW
jgi:polar amino acid transport system substrate-binding protein